MTAYNQFSSESSTRFNAFHIAQAVPASIVILGVTWWPLSGTVIKRLSSIGESVPDGVTSSSTWLLLAGLFVVSFCLGAAVGMLIKWAAPGEEYEGTFNRQPFLWLKTHCSSAFLRLGFYQPATTWEEAAQLLGSADESLIKLQLTDGSTVYGPFAEDSYMSLAPRPRGMYLERAFFQAPNGELEEAPGGAFIVGDEVIGIYILERN